MTLSGIDISHHQPVTPDLDGQAFVFARATYGLIPDDKYAQHAANVKAAGKVLGAYHFGRQSDGVTQARAFLNVVDTTTKLLALDYEKDGGNGHMTETQARSFIRTVQLSGIRCGLYASASGYPDLGQDWNWIAKWSETAPTHPWAFWQHEVSDRPGDNAGRLDRDLFNGGELALRRLAYLTHWRWKRRPGGKFIVYEVDEKREVITSRHLEVTVGGVDRVCTAPRTYPFPQLQRSFPLVKLLAGPRKGAYVHARWASEV